MQSAANRLSGWDSVPPAPGQVMPLIEIIEGSLVMGFGRQDDQKRHARFEAAAKKRAELNSVAAVIRAEEVFDTKIVAKPIAAVFSEEELTDFEVKSVRGGGLSQTSMIVWDALKAWMSPGLMRVLFNKKDAGREELSEALKNYTALWYISRNSEGVEAQAREFSSALLGDASDIRKSTSAAHALHEKARMRLVDQAMRDATLAAFERSFTMIVSDVLTIKKSSVAEPEVDTVLEQHIKSKPYLAQVRDALEKRGFQLMTSAQVGAARGIKDSSAPASTTALRQRGSMMGIQLSESIWRYPSFQFDDMGMVKAGVREVLEVLPGNAGGLALTMWFLVDVRGRDGRYWSPVDLLGREDQVPRLVSLVKRHFKGEGEDE